MGINHTLSLNFESRTGWEIDVRQLEGKIPLLLWVMLTWRVCFKSAETIRHPSFYPGIQTTAQCIQWKVGGLWSHPPYPEQEPTEVEEWGQRTWALRPAAGMKVWAQALTWVRMWQWSGRTYPVCRQVSRWDGCTHSCFLFGYYLFDGHHSIQKGGVEVTYTQFDSGSRNILYENMKAGEKGDSCLLSCRFWPQTITLRPTILVKTLVDAID